MSYFKHAIASLALIGALAAPAYAQGGGEGTTFADETVMMTTPTGAVVKKHISDKAMTDMMMKDAMPMTAGVMMMMHGGKMYMVNDKKMPDGKMLSDMMMSK